MGQNQVSKVTLHFVWGHLSKKQTVVALGFQRVHYSKKGKVTSLILMFYFPGRPSPQHGMAEN